ncbi:MAG TPA: putative DNA-binding domain-containing protein, partial [Gammaproteobacteria bacterium]|nr:putative DNA-binding domain-containing protein [Gammaproteobacteria bacterium]
MRNFQQQQYAFAAHLRDPNKHPAPADIEDRRMKIYRDLFFNSASSLLASTYPVLSKILGKDGWRALIRDYYASHICHTPLFPEVPQELLRYLQEERGQREGDPPFMLELAHYEWAELALAIDKYELDFDGIDENTSLLTGYPVISPLAWPLAYSYPVHKLSPDYQPQEPPPETTFLVVYRDRLDKVGFLTINAITARLLELLATDDEPQTGEQLLRRIASEINHPNPQTVVAGGAQLLNDLK